MLWHIVLVSSEIFEIIESDEGKKIEGDRKLGVWLLTECHGWKGAEGTVHKKKDWIWKYNVCLLFLYTHHLLMSPTW